MKLGSCVFFDDVLEAVPLRIFIPISLTAIVFLHLRICSCLLVLKSISLQFVIKPLILYETMKYLVDIIYVNFQHSCALDQLIQELLMLSRHRLFVCGRERVKRCMWSWSLSFCLQVFQSIVPLFGKFTFFCVSVYLCKLYVSFTLSKKITQKWETAIRWRRKRPYTSGPSSGWEKEW